MSKIIAKSTVVFCWLFGTLMPVLLSAQTITLYKKNATLPEIFTAIHDQTGYYFYYEEEAVGHARKIDIAVKQASLEMVLPICFKDQPLDYTVKDHIISVREKGTSISASFDLAGRVVDEGGQPVVGASIAIKGTDRGTATDENGRFTLMGVAPGTLIVVSSIGYESKEVRLSNQGAANIILKLKNHTLADVSVELSTGYQRLPKERATGSFDQISNELFNRSVSTNVLDRLDGISSGLLFNKNTVSTANPATISIRGRSTIFSNPNPLIVVDNFPYSGDITTINPNDVESITILKDAAAASIWGSFSGNGVIVITTKKGRFNQPLRVTANANVTVAEKPDLFYAPRISSADYIDAQQFLYHQGYYQSSLASPYSYVPPAVTIFDLQASGQLSPQQAGAQLNALAQQDIRNDISRYFYRKSINQQYALNFAGGGADNQYYFSAGYDKNLPSLTRNSYDRLSLTANNVYAFWQHKIELSTGIVFTSTHTVTDNTGYDNFPYATLVSPTGKSLALNNYKQAFIDTAGNGLLQDWNNRPLDELKLANNQSTQTSYRINTGLKYKVLPGLDLSALYQYEKGQTQGENLHTAESYFTRNLINSYASIDPSNGTASFPIPQGDILDNSYAGYSSQNVRAQVDFAKTWHADHELKLLAGAELRDVRADMRTNRLFGYDPGVQSYIPVNYADRFKNFIFPSRALIPDNISNLATINRYLSYFANAGYTYKGRYTFSASARRDESNLFGVNANQKGVPLWSGGLLWNIAKEAFYAWKVLPVLQLRVTDGYNGNVNNSVSAYTTATLSPYPSDFNVNFQNIVNPPNPDLRWERIHIINLGVDFGFSHILSGTIEYYFKTGKDLIGQSPLAPQTGVPAFTGNAADMKGRGMDITLNARMMIGKVSWTAVGLVSVNTDQVTAYKVSPGANSFYTNPAQLNPLAGHPLYSVYSYRLAGLDASGNPTGILDGKVSKDYGAILNSTDLSNLRYNGPVNPTVFGGFRNSFAIGALSVSANITYKFGSYFRRPSLNERLLVYSGTSVGEADYAKRWLQPGDEVKTNVPAFTYPVDGARSDFYVYSDALIEKGDEIRLQDLQASYEILPARHASTGIQSARIYAYVANVGILWKANHAGIDPDAVPGYTAIVFPATRAYSLGIKLSF